MAPDEAETRGSREGSKRRVRIPGGARVVEGEALRFFLGGEGIETPFVEDRGIAIVLCRVDGRLFALDALCPHEGGRLAEGPLSDGRYPFCPLHLFRFEPQSGAAVEGLCAPAWTYTVVEEGEDAVVRFD